MSEMEMLKTGDAAPDFSTIDCRGEAISLSQFRCKKKVVLFFFPRAFTPYCTEEVRYFQEHYARITAAGAELIGVSVDKHERNCEFAKSENLEFRLLGDESHAISEKYGVLWPQLRIDRRATFFIGLDGIIEGVLHHETEVSRHLDDVLSRLGVKAA